MERRNLLKKGIIGTVALSTLLCLANPNTVNAATWKKNQVGWWYQEDNGSWAANTWRKVNGSWYWFDQNGYMATGWRLIGGKWYYLQSSGAMLEQGWHWIGDKCYYMYDSGAMAANTWIGNYYVDGSGKWVPGKTKAQTKWVQSGNRWWYRHSDGSYTKNGWEKINGQWYYFDNAGWMVANQWVGDYYVTASGAMATNTWIGNYYVDGSGKWVPGKTKAQTKWVQSGNRWWYRHSDGSYTKNGWEKINGQWYYFDNAGWMVANQWVGDYYVTASGAMATNTWIGNYYVDGSGKWVPDAQKNQHEHSWVEKKHEEVGHWENKLIKNPWEETVHHEEEGHYENGKLLEKEQGHYEEVVVKPAWEEEKYVVDKEAWTETVNHPEEFHYETVVIKPAWEETVEKIKYVCRCGAEFGSVAEWKVHNESFLEQDDFTHTGYSNVPYHEVIKHPAVTEQKKVVDKEAWTETINHPEEGHTEIIKHPAVTDDVWVVDKPAVYEQVWVVDKEAWDEIIHHEAIVEKQWKVDKAAYTEIICSGCGEKKR